MTNLSDPSSRASPEHSAWQSLGEITVPIGSDPRRNRLPALSSILEVLSLSLSYQQQLEQAVCDAVGYAWDSFRDVEIGEPVAIRVFCQYLQDIPKKQASRPMSRPEEQVQASSWGFFVISNLKSNPDAIDTRQTIDLFLYPEG